MWPDRIIRQFNTVPPNPSEGDYHGPYNKLLNTLFPPDSDFVVVPQYLPNFRDSADFIVMFEILLVNKPVLILELRPPKPLQLVVNTSGGDKQIRSRMTDVTATCPIDTLYAIIALGTRLCFYSLDTTDNDAGIVPAAIPPHPTRVNDTAPASRWDCDILEPVGEERLHQIVQRIKDECEALM